MPAALPWLSVTSQAMVWTPFASAVLSKPATPSAVLIPENCATGKSAERSERLVHPDGTELLTAPSIRTCTVPPPGGSARRDPGARTQPKFVTDPLTAPPCVGVSMAPNGVVDELFEQVIVFLPSVTEFPSRSSAIA